MSLESPELAPEARKEHAPELTPDQKRFIQLLNEMMLAIHEVVYTSNLLDQEVINKYPELQDLVESIRKLGRVGWNFQKLAKRLSGGSGAKQ